MLNLSDGGVSLTSPWHAGVPAYQVTECAIHRLVITVQYRIILNAPTLKVFKRSQFSCLTCLLSSVICHLYASVKGKCWNMQCLLCLKKASFKTKSDIFTHFLCWQNNSERLVGSCSDACHLWHTVFVSHHTQHHTRSCQFCFCHVNWWKIFF